MTQLDRVGNRELQFQGGGGPSFLQVCEKRSQVMQKKILNVCTVMVLLHIYSKSLSVRSPVCPVHQLFGYESYTRLASHESLPANEFQFALEKYSE